MRVPPRGESTRPPDFASIAAQPKRNAADVIVSAVTFENERDTAPKPYTGRLADLLGLEHEVRIAKAGTKCYSLAVYRDHATRGNAGVIELTGIVLDLDHVSADDLDWVCRALRGRAAALYTTFSNCGRSDADRCARVVLPTTRHLTPNEARTVRGALAAWLGVNVDDATRDPSRIWFMPSCPEERVGSAFIVYTEGGLLDPDPWLVSPILPPLSPSTATRANANDWRTLLSEGASEGHRNHAATKLAGYFFMRDLDPFVVLELMLLWNRARNNPPLPDQEVIATVESIARAELKRRKGASRG